MSIETNVLSIEDTAFKDMDETLIELFLNYCELETSSDLKDREKKAYHFRLIRETIQFAEHYKKGFSFEEIRDKHIMELSTKSCA